METLVSDFHATPCPQSLGSLFPPLKKKNNKNCPLFHLPHPTVQELCLSLAKHFTKPTKERVGTLEVESGTDLDALNLLEEGYQEKGSERSRQGRGRA